MTFDEAFLSYVGGIHNNDLKTVLDINDIETNEPQTIRHSSYYDYDKLNELIVHKNDHFSVLSTNIQSINSKCNELVNSVLYVYRKPGNLTVMIYAYMICMDMIV